MGKDLVWILLALLAIVVIIVACVNVKGKGEEEEGYMSREKLRKKEREPLLGKRILCVGNSFGDDSVKYVREIAENLGVKGVTVANLYIGGCSLARHYQNALSGEEAYEYRKNDGKGWNTAFNVSLDVGLADEEWDVIVFQQQSADAGNWKTYVPYLHDLVEYVREKCPAARFAFNMTWAYPQDSDSDRFAEYASNQMAMYNAICKTVSGRIEPDYTFDFVIPTGTAVQNARALLGDNLNRDGIHLSESGRFLASLCWVKELYDADVTKLTYAPDCVTLPDADAFIQAATNAYDCPYAIKK